MGGICVYSHEKVILHIYDEGALHQHTGPGQIHADNHSP